jgi:flavin reductase (DIM6/NTAB) family NADH-FMN oxidoreductase RutF
MPLDATRFRHTMSRLVTGVAVVTVRGPGGEVMGMTASSVTSLSLAPPMLLVCVGRDASIHDALLRAERFGVSILGAGQVELARRFAVRERQRLERGEASSSPGGAPLLAEALARVECRREAHFAAGDHTIVTGTVEWSDVGDGLPLCYFQGAYARLGA